MFCVLLVAMAVASVALWSSVRDVLPAVGKDKQGEDPWTDQLGVEKVGPFQIAHIPDCAAAPVVRIVLWDEESKPYWEVSGPATPMDSFAVGVTPEGFKTETPYREPPAGAVQRLVVIRKVKGVAGVRYTTEDLRTGYVATGEPISRFLPDDFQTGRFCGGTEGDAATTSTTPADGG